MLGSYMRSLFAILSLLLCLIATHADDLPVIKDSEAVQYVGKNVEVRGLVVSMTPISECSGDSVATVTRRSRSEIIGLRTNPKRQPEYDRAKNNPNDKKIHPV